MTTISTHENTCLFFESALKVLDNLRKRVFADDKCRQDMSHAIAYLATAQVRWRELPPELASMDSTLGGWLASMAGRGPDEPADDDTDLAEGVEILTRDEE